MRKSVNLTLKYVLFFWQCRGCATHGFDGPTSYFQSSSSISPSQETWLARLNFCTGDLHTVLTVQSWRRSPMSSQAEAQGTSCARWFTVPRQSWVPFYCYEPSPAQSQACDVTMTSSTHRKGSNSSTFQSADVWCSGMTMSPNSLRPNPLAKHTCTKAIPPLLLNLLKLCKLRMQDLNDAWKIKYPLLCFL